MKSQEEKRAYSNGYNAVMRKVKELRREVAFWKQKKRAIPDLAPNKASTVDYLIQNAELMISCVKMLMEAEEVATKQDETPAWVRELRYMVGRGWIFKGSLPEDKWKADADLVRWVEMQWVEMDHERGFRITEKGIEFLNTQPKP